MSSPAAYLRLMRLGLAPTAAADVAVLYFLTHADHWSGAGVGVLPEIRWAEVGRLMLASVGLYAFGMVQNDLVDRFRDGLSKRDRPLVSGEVSTGAATFLAAVCAVVALASAYSLGRHPFLAALIAFGLINVYHLITKTAGGWGLLNLGLVRLANALMFLGDTQLTWPPFVVFAHVVLMSTAAYRLEGKPPALGMRDGIVIGLGCALIAGATAAGRFLPPMRFTSDPALSGIDAAPAAGLEMFGAVAGPVLGPLPWITTAVSLVVFAGFVAYSGWLGGREDIPAPQRGGLLIKNGLLYLIVIDASFLVFDRWTGAAVVGSALPVCLALMNALRKPSVWKGEEEPPRGDDGKGNGAP